jgi:hypothetical protein
VGLLRRALVLVGDTDRARAFQKDAGDARPVRTVSFGLPRTGRRNASTALQRVRVAGSIVCCMKPTPVWRRPLKSGLNGTPSAWTALT